MPAVPRPGSSALLAFALWVAGGMAHAEPAAGAPPAAGQIASGPADDRPVQRPVAFIRALYRAQDTGQGGLNPTAWTSRAVAPRLFVPGLAELAEVEGQRAVPDRRVPFDPFTGPMPDRPQRLAVRTVAEAGGRAEVSARFFASGRMQEVAFRLVDTAAGWRIADIRWGTGRTGSLAGLLR